MQSRSCDIKQTQKNVLQLPIIRPYANLLFAAKSGIMKSLRILFHDVSALTISENGERVLK